jgi:hypothetical protein
MNYQLIGRPIGKIESASVEVNGSKLTNFGPGLLYDSRVVVIADAIRAGELEGEIYADGEVWADSRSFTEFLARRIPA